MARAFYAALLLFVTAVPAASTVTFVERAHDAGIDLDHDPLGAFVDGSVLPNDYGTGFAWTDINNDGWPDLIIGNGAVGRSIFLNNGDGSFDDVTHLFNRDFELATAGVAAADVDNNGRPDVAFAKYYHEPLFYEGSPSVFAERTETVGLDPLLFDAGQEPPGWEGPEGTGLAWGDYDIDGYLDVYFANYRLQPDMLLRGLGGQYFLRTDKVDVNDTGWGFQPVFLDFDNDDDLDIFVANDFGRNFLFENQGEASGWTFVETATIYRVSGGGGFPAASSLSMGVAVGDFDNDLDLDLYITNYNENELYVNEGPFNDVWRFTKGAQTRGIQHLLNCWGTEFFDADNDGDLDLVFTGGWIPSQPILDQGRNLDNKFYLNDGSPDYSFTDATVASGFSDDQNSGRGLALADYDRDGDLDVAIWNHSHYNRDTEQIEEVGPFQLFRNDVNDGNHWVVFKLEGGGPHGDGTGCNRSGVGGRVYLTTAAGTQMREVRAGGSFFSQSSIEVEFGLGLESEILEVRVDWICGADEIFVGCESDRFYKLVEGKGTPDPLPAAIASFAATSQEASVRLEWVHAPWLDVASASFSRAIEDGGYQPIALDPVVRPDGGSAVDHDVEQGVRYRYRLELRSRDQVTTAYADLEITVGRALSRRPVLGQNFPNPFNPTTTILFELPERMHARVSILDARGRRIALVHDGLGNAGENQISWDGTDFEGRQVASGAYQYLLETEAGTQSRRLTLVR